MRLFTVQQQPLNIRNIEKRFSSTKAGVVVTRCALALTLLSVLLLIGVCSVGAQTMTTLYNFTGGSDGEFPNSSLTPDGKGNFFGTTFGGGLLGYGTVFELSTNGHGGWNEIVLHSFNAYVDGAYPTGPLAIDRAGNLYGVAGYGVNQQGVIFEVSPVGTGWTTNVIYNFMDSGEAYEPYGGLIIDPAGNLYGISQNSNSVFELSPAREGWTLRVLYVPPLGTNLTSPTPVMDAAGDIFGSQFVVSSQSAQIFELSPNGSGGWNETVIYTFPGNTVFAFGPLAFDSAGSLYGTAMVLRAINGSIFKLTPGENGKLTEKTIYNFDGPDGSENASFVIDPNGNIFGTNGTVFFELVPPVGGRRYYKEKILFNFPFGERGSSAPVLDSAGNLFATTEIGGWASSGTAYEVSP